MQGRGRFFIILGVVLLALAIVGGLLIVVLQGRTPDTAEKPSNGEPGAQATEEPPEMREVVVALQNIGVGEELQPGTVEVRAVEVEELPDNPITRMDDVKGTLARQDIYQGDVLAEDVIIDVDDVQRLGWRATFIIPEDRVAVAFPVSQLSSVNYAIQPGDRVDVLASGAFIDVDPDTQIKTPLILEGDESCEAGCQPVGEQVQRSFTQLTIDEAEVLGIGPWGEEPSPQQAEQEQAEGGEGGEGAAPQAEGEGRLPTSYDSIILMVRPQDAVVLKFLRENGFVIDLALRSGKDASRHETEQVTLEYIMTRFRISPPTKLPYRLEAMEERGVISTAPQQPAQ